MTGSRLIPQWFSCLQHVLDALLRLLRAEERKECLALQLEDVVLRHVVRSAVAACQNARERMTDTHVVLRRVPRLTHRPDAVFEIADRFASERANPPRRRRRVIARELQHPSLCVTEQVVAIHRHTIAITQESK